MNQLLKILKMLKNYYLASLLFILFVFFKYQNIKLQIKYYTYTYLIKICINILTIISIQYLVSNFINYKNNYIDCLNFVCLL